MSIDETTIEVAPAIDDRSHQQMRGGVARESLWLFAGYALTAAVGFVFWIVAARALPAAELGEDAGLLSLITATAALSSSGLGSALVVMLGRADSTHLLRRAMLIAIAASAVLGIGAGLLAHTFIVPEQPVGVVIPVMVLSCVVWALLNLQGQAIVGFGRAPVTLLVNGPVNIAKLLLISVVAGFSLSVPHAVVFATIVPALVAVVIVAAFVLPRLSRRHAARVRDGFEPVSDSIGFVQYVVRDTAAIGLTLGVGLSLAFFVTVLSGPVAGAVFSIAYQFSVVLDLVTVSVATALGRGASTRAELSAVAFGLWKRTVVFVALAAAVATTGAPVVFHIMGPEYDPAIGTAVVALLGAACVARSPYELWTGLLRSRRLVGRIAAWNAIGAVIVLGSVFALTPTWGAIGAAVSVLAGALVLGTLGFVGLVRETRIGGTR